MKLKMSENVMPGAEGFFLKGTDYGIMLIHGGGGGTAADMRELGQFIHEKTGYSVFAPLLPGYGTTKEELAKIQVEDWLSALKQDFIELKNEVQKVFLLGHSMGGVSALYLAGEFSKEVAGVIAISTPTKIKGFLIKLVPLARLFIKYWKQNDLEEFNRVSGGIWVGYEKIPLSIVGKFKKLMKLNNAQLNRITAPILIIQGRDDEFVPRHSPTKIYENVSSTDKSITWFDSDHAILFSKIKIDMFLHVVEFLKKYG
ncbi:MAG: alpha/beta fold hydrolase [Candidatus Helarchaeota archaeon]|nr:alpha/beta fold hydrolase [Candidatus Helarchaeota archaeon]